MAWAVRPGARQLRDTLDAWIAAEKTGALFDRLYQKYFVDAHGYKTRVASRFVEFTGEGGKVHVRARTVWAMLDKASGRPVRITDEFAAPFLT